MQEMRGYLDRGYTVLKMKIGGVAVEEDLRRIEAVLGELTSCQRLAVDANGRFDRDAAIACGKALSQYDLPWYEEAGDPLDFELQAGLAALRGLHTGQIARKPTSLIPAVPPQAGSLRRVHESLRRRFLGPWKDHRQRAKNRNRPLFRAGPAV
jgi:enolase-like protein